MKNTIYMPQALNSRQSIIQVPAFIFQQTFGIQLPLFFFKPVIQPILMKKLSTYLIAIILALNVVNPLTAQVPEIKMPKEESKNKVTGSQFEMGQITIGVNNPVVTKPKQLYIKELSPLILKAPAKALVEEKGFTIMSVSAFGKGTVFAVGDPWLYNEYTDGRKIPLSFENNNAAVELANWLLSQTKK